MVSKSESFFLFALFCVGLCVYGSSLSNPFLFDDTWFIQNNEWLKIEYIQNYFRSFIPVSNLSFVGYRPLVLTSLAIQKTIHGLNPFYFRLFNLGIHFLNACILLQVVKNLLSCEENKYVRFLPYGLVTVFFMHPLQSNMISLIWKRSDLFVSCSMLTSLLFFQKWIINSKNTRFLVFGHIAAFFAYLSKESALIFPMVILSMYVFFRWHKKINFREKIFLFIPILVIQLMFMGIVFFVWPEVVSENSFRSHSYMPPSMELSKLTYVGSQFVVFFKYVYLTIIPKDLRVFHKVNFVHSLLDLRFVLSILGVFFLMSYAYLKRKQLISVLIIWVFMFLIPTWLITLSMVFDENRMYLSMLGVWGPILFFGIKYGFPHFKNVLTLGFMCLVVLFSIQINYRMQEWKDPITLWKSNVLLEPNDPRPWVNLAAAYSNFSRDKEAQMAFKETLRLDPHYAVAWYFQGVHQFRRKQWDEAEKSFTHSLQLKRFVSKSNDYLKRIDFIKEKDSQSIKPLP